MGLKKVGHNRIFSYSGPYRNNLIMQYLKGDFSKDLINNNIMNQKIENSHNLQGQIGNVPGVIYQSGNNMNNNIVKSQKNTNFNNGQIKIKNRDNLDMMNYKVNKHTKKGSYGNTKDFKL